MNAPEQVSWWLWYVCGKESAGMDRVVVESL